jgi:hypothetical protein
MPPDGVLVDKVIFLTTVELVEAVVTVPLVLETKVLVSTAGPSGPVGPVGPVGPCLPITRLFHCSKPES